MDVQDKREWMEKYARQHRLTWDEVLFMGDDIPDLGLMVMAGLPCAPSDAVAEIKELATYISRHRGGKGCVRDVIEKVLTLQDHWEHEPEGKSRAFGH